jgi:hypothetical protein
MAQQDQPEIDIAFPVTGVSWLPARRVTVIQYRPNPTDVRSFELNSDYAMILFTYYRSQAEMNVGIPRDYVVYSRGRWIANRRRGTYWHSTNVPTLGRRPQQQQQGGQQGQ